MRILVVKLSSLGDLFHALPAVHNLKVGLRADVDWVTQPEYTDLVRCFEDVADVIPFPRHHWARGFPDFARRLRLKEYDLAVDLQGLMKSALVCRLARARRILGPSFRREGSGLLYSAVAGPLDKERHAVEENLDAVRFLGLERLPPVFAVHFPPAPVESPHPRVALLPVSRRVNKNWPEERFIEVARGLRRDFGAQVYCFGGPEDASVCAEIEQSVNSEGAGPRALNLAGQTRLVDMGSWLSAMDLVIGNDSGPIHMAAAVGVPVVAVFGPTDPRRTGPYGPGHRVIVAEVKCRPCHRRACRYAATECLEQVTAEQVLAAAGESLRSRGAAGGGGGMTARRMGACLTLLAAAGMALAMGGCSAPVESLDDREREHPMMKTAMERERAGDERGAIDLYKALIDRMPDMARPHLAVAFLLDKPGRDPAKAVYHYQRYLELRPDTEKHDMLEARIRQAKIQMISGVFPSVSNLAVRLLEVERENGQLRIRVTNLITQVEYQKAIVEKLRAQAAALEAAERYAVERMAAPATGMQPTLRTLRVEPGDSLIKIATRVYGDPLRWRDILEANRNVLRSKDDLRAGQTLVLP